MRDDSLFTPLSSPPSPIGEGTGVRPHFLLIMAIALELLRKSERLMPLSGVFVVFVN
jgi:hypothetical protein